MPLEGGLEELKNKPSSTFDRQLQEWGVRMPNVYISDFLHDAFGVKEVDKYWDGQKMDEFCFSVVQERNDGHKNAPINPDKRKELYEALKKYTNDKITAFKNKEDHKEKFGITTEDLIKKKNKYYPLYGQGRR